MVNNFEEIKKLLVFDSPDDFYHVQIIKRKKDNPGLPGRNNNARCVKTYYVSSIDYLEEKKQEMIALGQLHNARVCINLNRRSFEKIAYQLIIKVTGQIMSKDFKSVRRAYESVCGAYSHEPHKKWIVDIDTKDESYIKEVKELIDLSRSMCQMKEEPIIEIPTKNGVHVITAPFNVKEFNDLMKGMEIPEIHKDNPTLLFVS